MKELTCRLIDELLDTLLSSEYADQQNNISAYIATELNIGKATLYRYLNAYPALKQKYRSLGKRGNRGTAPPSENRGGIESLSGYDATPVTGSRPSEKACHRDRRASAAPSRSLVARQRTIATTGGGS